MQLGGLTFTFDKSFLKNDLGRYFDVPNDLIEVASFYGMWSLVAKIEELAKTCKLRHDSSCYECDDTFLVKLYLLLKEEKDSLRTTKSPVYTCISKEKYEEQLDFNLKNLEYLLFYLEGRIAASEFFIKLSEPCYEASSRQDWLNVCKEWGNKHPSVFKTFFWIKYR